jgi:hypothetical protein
VAQVEQSIVFWRPCVAFFFETWLEIGDKARGGIAGLPRVSSSWIKVERLQGIEKTHKAST